ncbi:MAG: hypothetical protein CMJ84_16610 [Planctomycetes bacterium]|jgi:putative restriction endonuclease|nr:hypothetical protein [Planctomycetota bacterium]
MPSSDDLLLKVSALNTWRRGGERAPHKPLLLLLALGRVARGAERLVPFSEIDEPLKGLLREFGPPRTKDHPEYPFWRLQRDDLWEVPGGDSLARRKGNVDPLRSELLAKGVGGFPEDIHELLSSSSALRMRVAHTLLDAHFPPSLHEDLLDAVGIHAEAVRERPARDPRFRREVLEAYDHACTICGFDGRIGSASFGLEAAHIRWKQAYGPDQVTNGLALCALHHKALDRGVVGLRDDLTLMVSASFTGSPEVRERFLSHQDHPVRPPHASALAPKQEYLDWHRREVFRFPARGEIA